MLVVDCRGLGAAVGATIGVNYRMWVNKAHNTHHLWVDIARASLEPFEWKGDNFRGAFVSDHRKGLHVLHEENEKNACQKRT